MKRLALTVTTDLHYDQRMQRIAAALAEGGYEVWLIGRALPHSPALRQVPWRQVRLRCRFHKGKAFYLEFNLRLAHFLARRRWDAIAAADLDTLLPATAVAALQRIPLVFDAHEHFTEVPEVIDRPLVKALWECVGRWCIPRARLAYTVGPQLAQVLARHYGRPFEVVRNLPLRGAAPARHASMPGPPYVLLYQGALNEGRGLECAIDAMALLPSSFELWLAGEGDRSEALRRQAQASPARARIRFLGRVDPTVLRKLTPQAWIGLNLLENKGMSYYYSLANKAFDYLHAGLPAIHPDFPEYRGLVAEWQVGLLLERLDAQLLAQMLVALASEPARWLAMHRACLEAREVFDWQREATHLRRLYASLWP